MLFLVLFATTFVSLISLIGIFFLSLKENILDELTFLLISLSAGTLLGTTFFHLLPETITKINPDTTFTLLIVGFVIFFTFEKIFRWRHCHAKDCERHPMGYLSLFGDGIHNFIDGAIIAISFSADVKLGFFMTMTIILHEIPEEIGHFGLLLYSGVKKKKAILYNFFAGLTSIFGGVIFWIGAKTVSTNFIYYLLPLVAGNFLYIGSSDLIPELHKETKIKKSLISFGSFLVGLVIMYLLSLI